MKYAQFYNAFFSQYHDGTRIGGIHKRRRCYDDGQLRARRIVHRMITACKPQQVLERFHVTRHLHTLAQTQTMGRYFGRQTRQHIYTEHRLAFLAWVVSRLRPLQRRVLQFLWKPDGPMAQRSMREGLSAIYGAA